MKQNMERSKMRLRWKEHHIIKSKCMKIFLSAVPGSANNGHCVKLGKHMLLFRKHCEWFIQYFQLLCIKYLGKTIIRAFFLIIVSNHTSTCLVVCVWGSLFSGFTSKCKWMQNTMEVWMWSDQPNNIWSSLSPGYMQPVPCDYILHRGKKTC